MDCELSHHFIHKQIFFSNGYTLREPLLGDSNAHLKILKVQEVLSFSSTQTSAIKPESLGDIVLLDNHDGVVTIEAVTKDGCTGSQPAISSALEVQAV